jgi:hypothetical protein
VGAALGALAVAVGAQELLLPGWTAYVSPALLGLATLAVGLRVLRHGRGLDDASGRTWRGFGVIAALLALGQGIRAVTGVGINPVHSTSSWPRPGRSRR